MTVNYRTSPQEKICLFRSLFRGREDVYPHRFVKRKTGEAGYSPVCANEWQRGLCEKPRVKCAACPHRSLLPVTDDVIRQHLSGKDNSGKPFVCGVYPMLLDETCFFLAADFDKKTWQQDCTAVLETCREYAVPASLERSRSGNGGHLWIFFTEAIPATQARSLGSFLLTRTMERRPEIGLDSYDRFFPNQDTLPSGGFGNLIALPLQYEARQAHNSEFLNDEFQPYPDQWAFLSSIHKMEPAEVETVIREAERKGGTIGVRLALSDENADDPWTLPPSRQKKDAPITTPLPDELQLTLGDQIYFAKEDVPPELRNLLIRLAAFQNPEFYRAQAIRLPTYKIPRIIACAEDHPKHLSLPRGCLQEVQTLLTGLNIKPVLKDERNAGVPLPVDFQGELRPDQRAAVEAILPHDTGVLAAATAFGKTVVSAYLIAQRAVNTLVVVHRKPLQEQWVERLSFFLGIPAKEIGRFGGGKKKSTGRIDIALMQSLVRKGVVHDSVAEYGQLIFDECHHLPAQSFEAIARRVQAKYVVGLSATVARKDGHHPIIFMQCGPIRYRVNAKEQAQQHPFAHIVQVHPTGFLPPFEGSDDPRQRFQELTEALVQAAHRNKQIIEDVLAAVREGRSPVVLTERTEHLTLLAEALRPQVQHVIVLQGGMGKKASAAAQEKLKAIPPGEERVLLATGRFLGEGFDDARLDTLFLTLPVSWRGTIAQYAGRLHRLKEGKSEVVIHDYADLGAPMLARMFDKRCKSYESIGYTVMLPASAVSGWPVDVPLPVDPAWKSDYAASIQRMVRDGVDAPLANLFIHAAREWSDNAEGIQRARSASEAFLFRRLESLPEAAGRFSLNQPFPIPFDGCGKMEVDLTYPEAKIAIEIDGSQHMGNADCYRRDRRKDALLQENGWFVLRFLAEDVGRRLPDVLDAILRAMACRRRYISF